MATRDDELKSKWGHHGLDVHDEPNVEACAVRGCWVLNAAGSPFCPEHVYREAMPVKDAVDPLRAFIDGCVIDVVEARGGTAMRAVVDDQLDPRDEEEDEPDPDPRDEEEDEPDPIPGSGDDPRNVITEAELS